MFTPSCVCPCPCVYELRSLLSYRQYFDLHDMFVRWVNLPQCKDKGLEYSQFLKMLGKFEDIPELEKVLGGCIFVSHVLR